MGKFTPLDFEEYVALARQAAAEGCVLLKNDNEALPLRKGDKVAVFGRIAFHYYKSGLDRKSTRLNSSHPSSSRMPSSA